MVFIPKTVQWKKVSIANKNVRVKYYRVNCNVNVNGFNINVNVFNVNV